MVRLAINGFGRIGRCAFRRAGDVYSWHNRLAIPSYFVGPWRPHHSGRQHILNGDCRPLRQHGLLTFAEQSQS